jgi:hypothetical protein
MPGINMKSGLALCLGLAVLVAGCTRARDPAKEAAPAASVAVAPTEPGEKLPVVEPALMSMELAEPPHKMGVSVDLRYQFEDEVKSGRPVTLHLAAVPRVAGSNLSVSIKSDPGISVDGTAFLLQKASASTAYRQQVSVTKLVNRPVVLRVLVTMETSEGSAHSWFSVPMNEVLEVGQQKPVRPE